MHNALLSHVKMKLDGEIPRLMDFLEEVSQEEGTPKGSDLSPDDEQRMM